MIEYIKGEITEVTPTYAVVENNGIGYFVNISLYTYTELQNSRSSMLYIYESIREDAHVLYGFIDKHERELFLLLISVSGVGPNSARMIQSSLSPSELENSIATSNVSDSLSIQIPANNEIFDEALAALVMLGFSQQASQKVLKKLLSTSQSLNVEDVIKKALKMM